MTITNSDASTRIIPYLNPITPIRDLWRHRELIRQFTTREIEGRYKGSYLGLLWSFITPLVMLLVFTFVFGVVFKARWPHERGGDSLAEFALVMFAGQLAYQVFSEPASRAATMITGVPNFVKKVVFPIQILPVAVVGAGLYHVGVGMFIACGASLLIYGSIPWTAALLPLSIAPLAMLGLGVTWFIASLGVYLRDTSYVVAVILQILFFATPIFYPINAIPEPYRIWIHLNPLTPMVELVRGNLIMGTTGDAANWALAYIFGLLAMMLGYVWFMITRKGFADVL